MLFYLFACCIREHTHALYFAVGSKGSSIAKHNIKLQYLWITKHRICIVMLLFLEWTYEKVHIVLCTRIRGYGQQEKTKQDYSHSWMSREKRKKTSEIKIEIFCISYFWLGNSTVTFPTLNCFINTNLFHFMNSSTFKYSKKTKIY